MMGAQKQYSIVKIKKLYLLSVIILSLFSLNAQIVLKEIIDEENPAKNRILVYTICNEQKILIDSLMLFVNFFEHSYSEYNGVIYKSWCSAGFDYKCYQINTYYIHDKSLKLKDLVIINNSNYKDLFAKSMSIRLTECGLCFSFKTGKIREIVLSYQDLELNNLQKFLKKLSNLQCSKRRKIKKTD
jgi:hypothetical protein